jgi:hypothetical protein
MTTITGDPAAVFDRIGIFVVKLQWDAKPQWHLLSFLFEIVPRT